nr:unnamed protein product [Callosobruchus analis]
MFFEISPARPEKKVKPVNKEKPVEKLEVLSLAPFTPNPKLYFEDVIPGRLCTEKLLVKNPTKSDITLFVTISGASEEDLKPSWTQKTVEGGSETLFELQWIPKEAIVCRISLIFEDLKRYRRDVPVVLKSAVPKETKMGAKKKKVSPSKRMPTIKYYTSRPPRLSPTKFSPKAKPTKSPKKLSRAETSLTSPNVYRTLKNTISDSPNRRYSYSPKRSESPKSMIPILVTPPSASYKNGVQSPKPTYAEDKNITDTFKSPHNSMFRLNMSVENDQNEKRGTYVVKKVLIDDTVFISEKHRDKSPEFDDSLEETSPMRSQSVTRRVLTEYTGDNTCDEMSLSAYINKKLDGHARPQGDYAQIRENAIDSVFLGNTSNVNFSGRFKENITPYKTFNMDDATNISSATYTKTYVETSGVGFGRKIIENITPYKTFNMEDRIQYSSAAYTKTDISLGTIASLSPNEIRYASSPIPFGEVEAITLKQKRLSKIEEERNSFERSLKRRRDVLPNSPPPKRPTLASGLNDWTKKGGSAVRVAKKSSGLNPSQFYPKAKAESTITKTDTSQIIVKDPFLLAATNLADPFMTPQLRIDEAWIDQQQVYFKKWLNALLTPPEELLSEEKSVDVAKVWQECKTREVQPAVSKEFMSNQQYTNHKLDSIRKAAMTLYLSPEMTAVLVKLHNSIDSGKISVRADKDIHLNLSLKTDIINLINNYNPLWLRIGLETIYREVIPMKSNSDIVSLNVFIANRLLKDPNLLKKHKTIHGNTYKVEFKKFFLKRFLTLVYFLDQAKNKKLIPHDPCLFCRQRDVKDPVKESKELLFRLAKEVVSSIGDITKFLKYLDYVVTHHQTYIHEFEYAVQHLGVDLRDGVRLTKLMEIILLRNDLTEKLRVPAISRLQKIHNVQVVFDALKEAGYDILYEISAKDIADGHKEKTLSFLWQIIYKFEAPLMVKSSTTIQKWYRSLPVVLKRKKLERERLRKENAAKKIQQWYRRRMKYKQILSLAHKLKVYFEYRRRQRAATSIQSYYRMYRCRSVYLKQKKLAISLQCRCRGWLVRNVYKNQIRHVIVIQSYIRMYFARKHYLALKRAAIIVQRKFRALLLMKEKRHIFVELRCATVFTQRRFRANRLMVKERDSYQLLRKSAIVIQRRFRANKLAVEARKAYLTLMNTCIFVQRRFRALVLMKEKRRVFVELRSASIYIQRKFRANKLMAKERENYQQLRKSAIIIQQRFRANKLAIEARQRYLALKDMCLFVQRRFKALVLMKKGRSAFLELRTATIFVQRRFRANKLMVEERQRYQQLRKSTIFTQQRFRAKTLAIAARQRYLALKKACLFVQRRFKALVVMKKARSDFLELRAATIFIQRRFRANKLMLEKRQRYQQLRKSAIFIQQRFRANKLAVETRQQYLALKSASVFIQNRYRALKEANKCRERYLRLRKAAIITQSTWKSIIQRRRFVQLKRAVVFVQNRYRANKLGDETRQNYIALREACIFAQRRYRALKEGRICRESYLQLKKSAITMQSNWKCLIQRRKYLQLKGAATVIQRRFRANKIGKATRHEYLALKKACLFIQTKYRAVRDGKKCREEYLRIRKSAVTIQSAWKCKIQRRKYLQLRHSVLAIQRRFREKQRLVSACIVIQRRLKANRLMKLERMRFSTLRTSVIIVQRRFRAKLLGSNMRKWFVELRQTCIFVQQRWKCLKLGKTARHQYLEMRKAATLIQNKWRANIQHKRYMAIRRAAVAIQNKYRATALMKIERSRFLDMRMATVRIQRYYRQYLMRKRRYKIKQSVLGIQTLARGFLLRKKFTEQKVQILEQRKQVLAAVKIQCRKSLSPKFSEIRKRVKTESQRAIEENTLGARGQKAMAVLEADNTLYTIIKALEVIELVTRRSPKHCTNYSKSLPELLTGIMGSINRSLPETEACIVSTNIMINFYKHEGSRPFSFVPNSLDAIFKIMLHFCDKECELFPSLCTLLWLYAHEPKWKKVIQEVHDLEHMLLKIHDLIIRKKNMVQKSNTKKKSLFAAEKCKLPNLDADWGYEIKNKPFKFGNSIFGFEQLLKILDC